MIHAFRCPAYRRVIPILGAFFLLLCHALAQPHSPFTFLAIGDAGQPGPTLDGNASAMKAIVDQYQRDSTPVGLLVFLGDNFYPIGLNRSEPVRAQLIQEVIGPHREVMTHLARANVHAIAGNHDYYCRIINGIPMNTCGTGNRYEDAISLWSYHYHFPASLRRSIFDGSRDSVELIFFDSAYLLTRQPDEWRAVTDSLERLLRRSGSAPGVKWRLFMAHHSPYSIGEHGGWRRWLPQAQRVGYIGNCIDEHQDPFRYVQEFFSSQDNCTPLYRAYSDTLMSIIERSGVRVHAIFAGHDHSLQLLNYPERNCANCPKIFVISGAGSKRERVKSPSLPNEFAHPMNNDTDTGKSPGGFVVGRFEHGKLMLHFVESGSGDILQMGDRQIFEIDESGALLNAR